MNIGVSKYMYIHCRYGGSLNLDLLIWTYMFSHGVFGTQLKIESEMMYDLYKIILIFGSFVTIYEYFFQSELSNANGNYIW